MGNNEPGKQGAEMEKKEIGPCLLWLPSVLFCSVLFNRIFKIQREFLCLCQSVIYLSFFYILGFYFNQQSLFSSFYLYINQFFQFSLTIWLSSVSCILILKTKTLAPPLTSRFVLYHESLRPRQQVNTNSIAQISFLSKNFSTLSCSCILMNHNGDLCFCFFFVYLYFVFVSS